VVSYDSKKLRPEIEKVKLVTEEDQGVLKRWGDRIYRISFHSIKPLKQAELKFTVKAR